MAGAGAVLMWGVGSPTSVALAALLIVAANCGFLPWNWPPACIFMGDVGSGYLGYVIGVLALAAARDNSVALYQWLILGGVFFADATFTFLRRLLRGESIHTAHRSHAYQRLARSWRSHRRVTLATWTVNIGWLLPCALFAGVASSFAWLITMVALAPVVCCVILAGAGRHETADATRN